MSYHFILQLLFIFINHYFLYNYFVPTIEKLMKINDLSRKTFGISEEVLMYPAPDELLRVRPVKPGRTRFYSITVCFIRFIRGKSFFSYFRG